MEFQQYIFVFLVSVCLVSGQSASNNARYTTSSTSLVSSSNIGNSAAATDKPPLLKESESQSMIDGDGCSSTCIILSASGALAVVLICLLLALYFAMCKDKERGFSKQAALWRKTHQTESKGQPASSKNVIENQYTSDSVKTNQTERSNLSRGSNIPSSYGRKTVLDYETRSIGKSERSYASSKNNRVRSASTGLPERAYVGGRDNRKTPEYDFLSTRSSPYSMYGYEAYTIPDMNPNYAASGPYDYPDAASYYYNQQDYSKTLPSRYNKAKPKQKRRSRSPQQQQQGVAMHDGFFYNTMGRSNPSIAPRLAATGGLKSDRPRRNALNPKMYTIDESAMAGHQQYQHQQQYSLEESQAAGHQQGYTIEEPSTIPATGHELQQRYTDPTNPNFRSTNLKEPNQEAQYQPYQNGYGNREDTMIQVEYLGGEVPNQYPTAPYNSGYAMQEENIVVPVKYLGKADQNSYPISPYESSISALDNLPATFQPFKQDSSNTYNSSASCDADRESPPVAYEFQPYALMSPQEAQRSYFGAINDELVKTGLYNNSPSEEAERTTSQPPYPPFNEQYVNEDNGVGVVQQQFDHCTKM